MYLSDEIDQRADFIDANSYFVRVLERERARRHHARSSQEKAPVRKLVVSIEVINEGLRIALQLAEIGRPCKDRFTATHDFQLDLRRWRKRIRGHEDSRTERATAAVNLRLRQVQGIFAFDVARTHVVADRVAND